MKRYRTNSISPVVGVILLVAITVSLVSLAAITVFDVGASSSQGQPATVKISETNGSVTVQVLAMNGADEIEVIDSGQIKKT